MGNKDIDIQKNSKRWTTLKSDIIVSRPPWLRVRHDTVQLPDGRINPEFYVLEYPDWVNVIAITEDGLFVMEKQYRYGIDRTCYEIPAGVMESGETPEEAARRELEEETGYTGGEWTAIMNASGNASTTSNMIASQAFSVFPREDTVGGATSPNNSTESSGIDTVRLTISLF